jgi:hypothetical protein
VVIFPNFAAYYDLPVALTLTLFLPILIINSILPTITFSKDYFFITKTFRSIQYNYTQITSVSKNEIGFTSIVVDGTKFTYFPWFFDKISIQNFETYAIQGETQAIKIDTFTTISKNTRYTFSHVFFWIIMIYSFYTLGYEKYNIFALYLKPLLSLDAGSSILTFVLLILALSIAFIFSIPEKITFTDEDFFVLNNAGASQYAYHQITSISKNKFGVISIEVGDEKVSYYPPFYEQKTLQCFEEKVIQGEQLSDQRETAAPEEVNNVTESQEQIEPSHQEETIYQDKTKLSFRIGIKTILASIALIFLFDRFDAIAHINDPELPQAPFGVIIFITVTIISLILTVLYSQTSIVYFDDKTFSIQSNTKSAEHYNFCDIQKVDYLFFQDVLITMKNGEELRISLSFYKQKPLSLFKNRLEQNSLHDKN